MCSTENHLHFDYVRLAWDSGFCFNESKSKIAFDISSLSLVDIERVTRDRDIATVVKYIPTILQFQLDEELSRILEPNFVKIFQLCQLAIQYLKYCKVYLDNTVILLKRDLAVFSEDNEDLQKCVVELKEENMSLQKQNLDLQKALNTVKTVTFKCDECPKVFYSEDYLNAHIKRRHNNFDLQTESEKLQLEIKELKQRLNNTEKNVIQDTKKNENLPEKEPNNDLVFRSEEQMQEKFEQLKDYINKELGSLKDENFYSKIYQKCFGEMYEKLQSPKKVYVEQGAGDSIEIKESSTQTNLVEEETNHKFEYKAIELKLNLQKELIENALDQKISGSLNRLEMEMGMFKNKLNDLEQSKKLEDYVKLHQQKLNELEVSGKMQQQKLNELEQMKIYSPKKKSRTIIGSNNMVSNITLSESETEKEDEVIVIKPFQTVLSDSPKMITKVMSEVHNGTENDNKERRLSSQSSMPSPKIVKNQEIVNVVKNQEIIDVDKKQEIMVVATEYTTSEDDLDMSEEQQEVHLKTPTTVSTLAKRSNTSLKEAVRDPDLYHSFRNELQNVIALKLKNIGVVSEWKSLPPKTFDKVFEIVKHKSSLSKKSITNYTRLRENILKELNKKMKSDIPFINGNKTENSIDDVSELSSSEYDDVPRGVLKVHSDRVSSKKKVIFNLNNDKNMSADESSSHPSSSTSILEENRVNAFSSESRENLNTKVQDLSDLELSEM
ncbi:PREDICTED: zinc finger protein Dzip1 [Nicrophorus vespilloides]|uniref:Zinc finger protein Dzip1 n=1 Tax=Nicrophorus vespilloides TaxID=110193 RepID=A0ABM1NHM7_NICVS|nr:PREDICTED: zinc finger protein Dzip1 [Nicrophorus vespilloides]